MRQRTRITVVNRDMHPRLPVWRDGQLQIVRCGNKRGHSRELPHTGWTWQSTLEEGGWAGTEAGLVDIPANCGLERRGVWFLIEVGIRGLLTEDIPGRVAADSAYQNASQKSVRQNANIGHDKVLGRVMMAVLKDDAELFEQFSDNGSFRRWLTDTIFTMTYDAPAIPDAARPSVQAPHCQAYPGRPTVGPTITC